MPAVVIAVCLCTSRGWAQTARWPEQKANAWYAQQPWLVGSNYVPKSAINQLEMWQEATLEPVEIDKELIWAEAMGMNTMRVFLHDLLWKQDAGGFQKRILCSHSPAACGLSTLRLTAPILANCSKFNCASLT